MLLCCYATYCFRLNLASWESGVLQNLEKRKKIITIIRVSRPSPRAVLACLIYSFNYKVPDVTTIYECF